MKNKGFFKKISRNYRDLIKDRGSKELLSKWIEPRMGNRVLDIGCGGIREFISANTQQYVGLDFSLPMLKEGDANIQKVCGDALFPPFKRGTFDTLLYRSVLHHLTGNKVEETEAYVKQALIEGRSLLKKNGTMIIVEPCIPPWLEKIERTFYFFVSIFCKLTHQPEVLIFSIHRLQEMLIACGFYTNSIYQVKDNRNKWRLVSPILGLPWLKIPLGLLPVCQVVFEAQRLVSTDAMK